MLRLGLKGTFRTLATTNRPFSIAANFKDVNKTLISKPTYPHLSPKSTYSSLLTKSHYPPGFYTKPYLPQIKQPRNQFFTTTSSSNSNSQQSSASNKILLTLAGIGAVVGSYFWGSSVPSKKDTDDLADDHLTSNSLIDTENPLIRSLDQFQPAGKLRKQGSSSTQKVQQYNSKTDKIDYFIIKHLPSRKALLNELVSGLIAKKLCGEYYPNVYIVKIQSSHNKGKVKLALLSDSPNHNHTYCNNLSEWTKSLYLDHEYIRYKPRHLGLAIAFDMLIGKSISLDNLINVYTNNSFCYSINHQDAFKNPSQFLSNSEEAFDQTSITNKYMGNMSYQSLKNAIKDDFTNGSLKAFYEKFQNISKKEWQQELQQLKPFIRNDEIEQYIEKLSLCQVRCTEFLNKQINNAEISKQETCETEKPKI